MVQLSVALAADPNLYRTALGLGQAAQAGIVDDLITNDPTKVLSAAQGYALSNQFALNNQQILAAVQSQIQTARDYAIQRANHTGTQLASSVVFNTGETLESQKIPFLTQGTAPSADAPSLTAAPTIAGSTSPGSTLTASPGAVTEGSGGSHTNIYQWQRVDLTNGAVDIFGATATTYGLTSNDNGFKITVKQTVKDAVTGLLGNTRSSLLTASVAGAVPGNTALPTISPTGSATAGSVTYTSTTGSWSGSPSTFSYLFLIGGVAQGIRSSTNTFTPNPAGPYGAVTVSVIATNGNGASTAAVSTTSVTASAPAGTGHLWTDMTSAQWTEIETEGAAQGDVNAAGYRARIAAVPTSGGVTISAGANIATALASNSLVFGNTGAYTVSAMITFSTNGKKLLAGPGQVMTINCIGLTDGNPAFNMVASDCVIGGCGTGVMIIQNLRANGVQAWDNGAGGSGNLFYHISIDGGIMPAGTGGAGLAAFYNARNTLICSCEIMNLTDSGTGGNADGLNVANNTAANCSNGVVDTHVFQNSDDGMDTWQSTQKQYFYFSSAQKSGKHPVGPNGDGNGFKCGTGIGSHNYYKCFSNDCASYGWNRNAGTNPPRLKACTQTGDDAGPLAGGAGLYNLVA